MNVFLHPNGSLYAAKTVYFYGPTQIFKSSDEGKARAGLQGSGLKQRW